MLREQWQRNLVGILIAAFVSILGFNLIFPFLPLYIQTLGDYSAGEAAFWTGVISLLTGVLGSIAALVWGQMADRRGRKPMVIRATAGAAVGLAVMGIAANIWHLLLGRLMFSALAGTVPASNPLIAANTPAQHLSMAMGTLQGAVFLSNTLGPLLGSVLASLVGFRATFLIVAALYVLSALPVIWLVKERFTRPAVTRGVRRAILDDLREVLGNRALSLPIVTSLLALAGFNVSSTVISLLVADMVGNDRAKAMAGIAFFVMGLASAVAAFVIGRLVSRFGQRQLLTTTALASIVLYLLLWWTSTYPLFVVLLAGLGLTQGAQVPALNAVIATRAPRHRAGAVFGVVSAVNSVAFSGGPFLAGLLARSFGLHSVFPVSALLLAGMLLLIGRATADPAVAGSSGAISLPGRGTG